MSNILLSNAGAKLVSIQNNSTPILTVSGGMTLQGATLTGTVVTGPSLALQGTNGPVWVVDGNGHMFQPLDPIVPNEQNQVRISQLSAVPFSHNMYYPIWDAVCDFEDVVSECRGKYLLVPIHYIEGLKAAASLYANNENYAGLTFPEFYRKLYHGANPAAAF